MDISICCFKCITQFTRCTHTRTHTHSLIEWKNISCCSWCCAPACTTPEFRTRWRSPPSLCHYIYSFIHSYSIVFWGFDVWCLQFPNMRFPTEWIMDYSVSVLSHVHVGQLDYLLLYSKNNFLSFFSPGSWEPIPLAKWFYSVGVRAEGVVTQSE